MRGLISRQSRVLAALERGEVPLGMQMYAHAPDPSEIVPNRHFRFATCRNVIREMRE